MTEDSSPALASLQMTLPAEDRIRETAKWLTVSLAAVGAVVINGTQFSNVGAVQWGSWRFYVVLAAAALAALGAGLILRSAVRTATAKPADLEEKLPEEKSMADNIARQGGIGGGAAVLVTEYKQALAALDAAVRDINNNPDDMEKNLRARHAQRHTLYLSQIVMNVARAASYEEVADRWKKDSRIIALGALMSLLGLLVFIWAINPPEAVAGSEASPAVVGEAAVRTLTLTPQGQLALAEELGNGCDTKQPLRVAHLDKTDTGPDVLVQQEGCKPLRLIITSLWGELKAPPPSLAQE